MFRKHVNGEKIKREWLMYSPSTGNIYCFPCVLFGSQTQFSSGFSDWKNASQRIKAHEDTAMHRTSLLTLISRRRSHGRIDTSLEIQFNKEQEYWISLLTRVVSVIKFLSSRGLAFRGESEHLGSRDNGNYLGILELLAEYDPFLRSHLDKYGNQGRGKPSYISSTICEELIKIMGDKVLESIVREVQDAKYFSLSVDSTPDISHVDQLTVILRYVKTTDGQVVERFFTFVPISSHTGEALATTVLTFLEKCNIDITYLRGQSYDNAANMSGCYNGLQAHIARVNKLAYYIPCAAHSLNLVGVCAVESCVGATSFFGLVQSMYNFFSASTHRWGVMLKCISDQDNDHPEGRVLVVKRVSDTRWCSRADAAKALSEGYTALQRALMVIAEDTSQTPYTIHEAKCLHNDLRRKENVIMAELWATILERINLVSKSLQQEAIEVDTAVTLLGSLLQLLTSQREMFDEYERRADQKFECNYTDETKRLRMRKTYSDDGEAQHIVLRGKDKFKVETFLPILDKLFMELSRRMDAYRKISELFGFLLEFPSMTEIEVKEAAAVFRDNYSNDIDQEFPDEMVHFKYFVNELDDFKTSAKVAASESFKIIFDSMVQSTFPNVMTALRIYRCLMITNATGERSFSRLKLLKNCHRSSMTQDRLNSLAIMATEFDVLDSISLKDILNDFTSKKLRRVNI